MNNSSILEFEDSIVRNQLQDLLTIPFYLVNIVELYRTQHALPQSKGEIFEQLLGARIQLDQSHYRTTIDLEKAQKEVISTLEYLAIGMEILGRNYITGDELQKLVPDENRRNLIKYSTVWRKSQGEVEVWEFEHKSFQEYLAARVLSRQNTASIKSFVSFEPEYKKVIPSWLNTVSFLIDISDNKDLLAWIMDNEPEIAVKFEPDKIDKTNRVRIFKQIFNRYREKQIWLNRDKFNYNELANFGQSDEAIDFILGVLESSEHYTTISNAIELLGYFDIIDHRQRATKLLIEYALNSDSGDIVQNHALIALVNLKIHTEEVINQILPFLRLSTNSRVRYGLYYFLGNGDYLDDNIDVFLEGIQYIQSRHLLSGKEARLANEEWHLTKGIEKARSPEALLKILTYFNNNPRCLDDVYFENIISTIADNCAKAYSREPSLFDAVLGLFSTLVKQSLDDEANQFIVFFDKTNTRLLAFQKFLAHRELDEYSLYAVATLADWNGIDFIMRKYDEKSISDEDVWKLQNCIGVKNNELYLPFNEAINARSNNKFILPPTRNFDEEQKLRLERDIELLFNKQEFLNEIERVFSHKQKTTLTSEEFLDIRIRRGDESHFSDLVIRILREIADDKTIDLADAIQVVNNLDWDWFRVGHLYEYLSYNDSLILSEQIISWIGNWCYSHLDKINFKTALVTKRKGTFSASHIAIFLWYFLQRFNLTYPRNILLDMLSFDWVQGARMGEGFEYLEKMLEKDELTNRVLENLQEGIKNDDVLRNHLDYCRRYEISSVIPFAVNEITNAKRNDGAWWISLQILCEMPETLSELEHALPKIAGDFKWDVVKELVARNNQFVHNFLLEILSKRGAKDKIKASEYLIQLQDVEGLDFYVRWIRRHKKLHERSSPIPSLKIIESVPLLLQLLKVSYRADFIQNDFLRLDNDILKALTAIALDSESNYIKVKKDVEYFIHENFAIENVKFLSIFVERLEREYYSNMSSKMDINDTVKKLAVIAS